MALSDPAETPLAVDYTNVSQGPRASENDALGNLFKSAAQIGDVAIKEADRQKRSDITDDILSQVDSIQEEFGVSSATDTEVDAESTGEAARPPALSRAYENLEYLQNAYVKGGIKESHYWARLNVMVRQLRAKYPGYRQDIDGMVSQVVGAKPANALRSALFQEWDDVKRAQADNPLAKLEDWAVKDGTLPPDYFDRKGAGDPYDLTELQTYVADKTRIKAETAARQANLSMQISQNNVDNAAMEQSYRTDATQFIQVLLGDTSKSIGKNYSEISAKIKQAQQQIASGAPPNQQELAALMGQMGQLRQEAQSALDQQFLNSWDGDPTHSYSRYINRETQQAIIQQALAPIDMLANSLNSPNNPYAVVGSTAAFLEALKNDTQVGLLRAAPTLSNIGALTQIAGPDTTAFILSMSDNADINALSKTLLDWSATDGALGQGSIVDALDRGETSSQKADYYNQLTLGWQNLARAIDSGEVPLQVIQNNVQYMFGGDANALLAKMDEPSRVMWYSKVASPEVTNQMLKLRSMGDEQSWNTYQDWVKGAFVNIFAQEMNGLNSFNDFLSSGGPYAAAEGAIYWDPDTSSFKAGLQWNRDFLGVNAALDQMLPGGSGAVTRSLNSAIQVIKPIIEENGGEIEAELALLIQQMGYTGQGIQGAMLEELTNNVAIQENPADPEDRNGRKTGGGF